MMLQSTNFEKGALSAPFGLMDIAEACWLELAINRCCAYLRQYRRW